MSKLAFQHPTASRLAILPNGTSATAEQAEADGFTIVARDTAAWSKWADSYVDADASLPPSVRLRRVADKRERERTEYGENILALPEAQSRPIAASKLAQSFSVKTMPPERAAIFLRGLPEEDGKRINLPTDQEPSMSNSLPANTDVATFKRKVELRLAAMAQRADHGDLSAKSEAKKLGYAVKLINTTNMNPIAALQSAGVDPATVK